MNSLSRRSFLAATGGLGLSVLGNGFPRIGRASPAGLPVGIQLWTVDTALQANPALTLRTLQRIGYGSVETAGLANLSVSQFRKLLDDSGLRCPSAHLDFLSGEPSALIDDAKTLGAEYAVSSILRLGTGAPLPGPAAPAALARLLPMTIEDALKTADIANKLGQQTKKAGIQFAYHNHYFEFVDQGGGDIAYDVLLRNTDPDLVKFEIDCGWMIAAGYDPLVYFQKYPNRFPLIHVKDFKPVPAGSKVSPALRVGTELGRGSIDYRPILAAAEKAGLKHYFAEQEGPFDKVSPLDAARVSFDYLNSIP